MVAIIVPRVTGALGGGFLHCGVALCGGGCTRGGRGFTTDMTEPKRICVAEGTKSVVQKNSRCRTRIDTKPGPLATSAPPPPRGLGGGALDDGTTKKKHPPPRGWGLGGGAPDDRHLAEQPKNHETTPFASPRASPDIPCAPPRAHALGPPQTLTEGGGGGGTL